MSIEKNLELTFALVRQAASDESFGAELTEASREGAMVLMPADDPELARSNENIALILASRGEPFVVRSVSRSLAPRQSP
jgi:hypothetical protein